MNVIVGESFEVCGVRCYEERAAGTVTFWSGGVLFTLEGATGRLKKRGHRLIDGALLAYLSTDLRKHGSARVDAAGGQLFIDDLISASLNAASELDLVNQTGGDLSDDASYFYFLTGTPYAVPVRITCGETGSHRLTLLEKPRLYSLTDNGLDYPLPDSLVELSEVTLGFIPASLKVLYKALTRDTGNTRANLTIPMLPPPPDTKRRSEGRRSVRYSDSVRVCKIESRSRALWSQGPGDTAARNDLRRLRLVLSRVDDALSGKVAVGSWAHEGLSQLTPHLQLFREPFFGSRSEGSLGSLSDAQKLLIIQFIFDKHGMSSCYPFIETVCLGPGSGPDKDARVSDDLLHLTAERVNSLFQEAYVVSSCLESLARSSPPRHQEPCRSADALALERLALGPDSGKRWLIGGVLERIFKGEGYRAALEFLAPFSTCRIFIHRCLASDRVSAFETGESRPALVLKTLYDSRVK